ncbi:MAG: hypothetical protein OXE79_06335 [Acidimicrobiaceae bacterium]|nr:hypothetical protein [Acidimicrobiaceae bacterium]MCY4174847.1 hypothetical protein [Acidimicrobiaceae bacterium]MCY4281022.1 hypothetical protein [Acidimicrobiaceae bacterium]MCY4294872.1 hypothetical protein [Acidimicrobiaceae bacterium]
MDLGGAWRVAAASEARLRTFHEVDHDDSGWQVTQVPGHWAADIGGAASKLAQQESVLYRRRFCGPDDSNDPSGWPDATDPSPAAEFSGSDATRWWLRFEGIAQQGDVWLDGAYLGHTDGYFVTHEMEVTEHLAARSEHVLAVEATCRRFGDPDNRTSLTGALQDPELCGQPDLIVGGIWRPATLRCSGPITIRHARAVCAAVQMSDSGGSGGSARLEMRAVLDVPGGGPVQLRTRAAGSEHVLDHHAAAGENRVEWSVTVADPPLWWPHALGEQRLCDLELTAMSDGRAHDRRSFRIGFRTVQMRRWVLHVNGEKLFAKGANLLPTRPLLGLAAASDAADDVRAARNAGLDLVRPVAHIARPELYDAADELGVLVWQDLPIRGLMNRSVAPEALRQAREAVDLLGHRPSVAVWCAHDQPFARLRRPGGAPAVLRRQRPSWNRDFLDRRLCRVISRCDGARPVVPHTAMPPRLLRLESTTSELWPERRSSQANGLAATLARLPAMGRFVSAFGTPAADEQPRIIQATVETLRRLKYSPTGGFMLHALADAPPAADSRTGEVVLPPDREGFGVLDGLRRPKPGWRALVEACKPLIVMADLLPTEVRASDTLTLAVHVVNDTRTAVEALRVDARVTDSAGESMHRQSWTGAVGADECALVGRLKLQIPQDCRGAVTLELTLSDDGGSEPVVLSTNRYTTTVV